MSKMSELHAEQQQAERLTDVTRPPTFEQSARADNLANRVQKFNCLELPGQPLGMHMGTAYLVNDLWREVERLRAAAKGGA